MIDARRRPSFGRGDGSVDEIRSTAEIDQLCRGHVIPTGRLAGVTGRRGKDRHGILETRRATPIYPSIPTSVRRDSSWRKTGRIKRRGSGEIGRLK